MSGMKELLRGLAFAGLRAAFRAAPLPEHTRDRLRQRFLDRFSSLVPEGPQGRLAPGARARRARVRSGQPAIGFVPRRTQATASFPAQVIAFYLPQFHAIPENDAWWGKGFTEWRNVTRALPQFEGHDQPRLPGDLGFYDLRTPGVMREQAALAREHGVGGFCFYFYWFDGRTLLEEPLRQWLADDTIEQPFCLCWANENWSRRWDGRADEILVGQNHSEQDDLAFISHVSDYLRDARYIRVDGKPLLLVYRPGLLPDAKATAARWRSWCRDNGVGEIFIAYTQSFDRADPSAFGFDAAVEFPPNLSTPANITAAQHLVNSEFRGQVLDWRELADDYTARPMPTYPLFPGVNCGWDNEARRSGRGRVFLHASPRRYRDWLRSTVERRLADVPQSDRLVFVNAWNEWAEGAVLEPDTRLGHAWLQATRDALLPPANAGPRGAGAACVIIHAWYVEALDAVLASPVLDDPAIRLIVTTSFDKERAVRDALAARGTRAEVALFENRGRDILPFLHVAGRLLDEGEQVVLKLHTKQSRHLENGERWREELVQRLASASRHESIRKAFDDDARLGLVAPEGHLLPVQSYLGANGPHLDYLHTRLGLRRPLDEAASFASGSMFWVRLEALRPLLDAHLDTWEFEDEAGQIDGTFAHAIERVFALCAEDAGFHVATAAAACGETANTVADGAYAYARRG